MFPADTALTQFVFESHMALFPFLFLTEFEIFRYLIQSWEHETSPVFLLLLDSWEKPTRIPEIISLGHLCLLCVFYA